MQSRRLFTLVLIVLIAGFLASFLSEGVTGFFASHYTYTGQAMKPLPASSMSPSLQEYSSFFFNQEPTTYRYKKGDIDGDGYLTRADVEWYQLHFQMKEELTPDQLRRADVTGDGIINVHDYKAVVEKVIPRP